MNSSISSNNQQMNRQQIIDYYSQDFVLESIVKASRDREAVGVFSDGGYDKRPNVVNFKSDILSMVKNGVTSIHLSAEHWTYPMQVNAETYEQLRKGFDIIIDIDSRLSLNDSKITAVLICDLLEKYNIRNYGVKFSGRRGFHICIPWKMLPKEVNFKPMHNEYPKVPRIVSGFIRHSIKDKLVQELLKNNKGLVFEGEMDPYQFVEVEKDWGNRHLFRAPLSLNEKTWMASIPLDYNDLKNFDISMANPLKVKSTKTFFKDCEDGEADILLSDALDWNTINTKVEQKKEIPKKQLSTKKVPEEFFPPCIKLVMNGLKEGKKRSLFTIINFLKSMNWSWEEIEQKVFEINDKNIPKLPRSVIAGQINWAKQQNKQINPANCNVEQFYKSVGICQPDNICSKEGKIVIKNPMNYPFIILSRIKKKEDNKKLKCYECKKEFDDMDTLKKHKRKHKPSVTANAAKVNTTIKNKPIKKNAVK
ncbi:MAG: hypothetical protein HY831_02455 [Candidatus Aenigmarchaeota archaeon]|nr:hypothetical protein [Candidatus Aenigmarchaeota archaeon]